MTQAKRQIRQFLHIALPRFSRHEICQRWIQVSVRIWDIVEITLPHNCAHEYFVYFRLLFMLTEVTVIFLYGFNSVSVLFVEKIIDIGNMARSFPLLAAQSY